MLCVRSFVAYKFFNLTGRWLHYISEAPVLLLIFLGVMNTYYTLQQTLNTLFSTETQLVEALPFVAESVLTPTLRRMLRTHFSEARRQRVQLQEMSSIYGLEMKEVACVPTRPLINDLREVVTVQPPSTARDLMLANKLRLIRAYEAAGYYAAACCARTLNNLPLSERLTIIQHEKERAEAQLTQAAADDLTACNTEVYPVL